MIKDYKVGDRVRRIERGNLHPETYAGNEGMLDIITAIGDRVHLKKGISTFNAYTPNYFERIYELDKTIHLGGE